MKTEKRSIDVICPRCSFLLVPVHDAGDRRRRVRSYCCPDPYCDYTLDAAALRGTRRPRTPRTRRLPALLALRGSPREDEASVA